MMPLLHGILTEGFRLKTIFELYAKWALRPVWRFAGHARIDRHCRLDLALASLGPSGRSLSLASEEIQHQIEPFTGKA
jgi:hypothetical protein